MVSNSRINRGREITLNLTTRDTLSRNKGRRRRRNTKLLIDNNDKYYGSQQMFDSLTEFPLQISENPIVDQFFNGSLPF
ncbi:unnamed protein product [Rhizophagus irregularis]|nr:unnamed protein product [Rhizophagus irregularis]